MVCCLVTPRWLVYCLAAAVSISRAPKGPAAVFGSQNNGWIAASQQRGATSAVTIIPALEPPRQFESESGYKHPRPRLTRSRVSTNIGSSGSISCAQSQHRRENFENSKVTLLLPIPAAETQPPRPASHLQLSVTARHTDRLAGQSQPKLSRLSFELESGDRERRG